MKCISRWRTIIKTQQKPIFHRYGMFFFAKNVVGQKGTQICLFLDSIIPRIQDASRKNIEHAPFAGKLMPRQETSMSTVDSSTISRQWTMEGQETLKPPFSRQCSMEFLDFEGGFSRQCTIDSCFAVQVDVSCMKVVKVGRRETMFLTFLQGGRLFGNWIEFGARSAFILQDRLSIDFIILPWVYPNPTNSE